MDRVFILFEASHEILRDGQYFFDAGTAVRYPAFLEVWYDQFIKVNLGIPEGLRIFQCHDAIGSALTGDYRHIVLRPQDVHYEVLSAHDM